jgi:hypothetical protein
MEDQIKTLLLLVQRDIVEAGTVNASHTFSVTGFAL